jgi:hypothetical protein
MADHRIVKWTGWVEGTIESNVLTMHLQRDAWLDVAKIVRENGQLPDSYWWQFMFDTYSTTQAVAVRRQADTHRDAASLGKLVEELRDDPSQVTREFWLGLWDSTDTWDQHIAGQQWDENYGGSVGTHLDASIPAADLDALTAAAASVKGYVDEHVAHADATPAGVTLTLQDVHGAIDVIGDVFRRYYSLFTAAGMATLVPAIQHNWKAIFQEPWIRAR